jgi:hypothetical protein
MRKTTEKLLLLSSFLMSMHLSAQESVNGSGGEASGSGGTVSYSIGQVVFQTQSGTNYNEVQGVQQPYEISVVTDISRPVEINLVCKVYPNPSTNYLHLEIEEVKEELTYVLYSIDGRVLKNAIITEQLSELSMRDYAPSTYLLEVKQAGKRIQTFKIIKN